MANYPMKCAVSLMVWTLATPLLPLAWAADDLNSVRFGEHHIDFRAVGAGGLGHAGAHRAWV